MADTFNIALVQLALGGTPAQNLEKSLLWVRKAARKGGQVICLPELYRSAYFCQKEDTRHFDLAEPLHRTSFEAFSALAKELGVVISVPFFERRAAGLYHNSAYLIDADGSQAGLYRKMHIPDDPSFYEKFYFTPGDLGFKAHPRRSGKSAPSSAGTSGTRRPPASRRSRAPRCWSTPRRSAGTRTRRPSTAPGSTMPG